MDKVKKDNLEMKNQVQGQHSIISGLRKERELWSKELAQQGNLIHMAIRYHIFMYKISYLFETLGVFVNCNCL